MFSRKKKKGACKIGDTKCVLITILTLFVIVLLFMLIMNYLKINKQLEALNSRYTTGFVGEEKSDDLLENVAEHILLPEDMTPEITQITDVEKLKAEQEFFKDAKNGDFLIIYPNKAIIFDQKADKVINVGPVYSNTIEPVRLEVRNGSMTEGIADTLGSQLGMEAEIEVTGVSEAANKDYEKTMLVNLSGKNISGLEQLFGVQAVNEMPEGEVASDAEVVVIVGNDVKFKEGEESGVEGAEDMASEAEGTEAEGLEADVSAEVVSKASNENDMTGDTSVTVNSNLNDMLKAQVIAGTPVGVKATVTSNEPVAESATADTPTVYPSTGTAGGTAATVHVN